MKRTLATAALLCTFLFTLFSLADTLTGTVSAVTDGDTIRVKVGKKEDKVRLMGIDAPEKSQNFGPEAKLNLSNQIGGQIVVIEFKKRDRYGRILGKVLHQNTDINLKQISEGYAWHYKQYEKDQSPADRDLYAETEADAQAQDVGLWQDANPEPPWDYRRKKRTGN